MDKNIFALKGASIKAIAEQTWAEIRTDDVFGRAAQLAYYFFLALFPFLICVIATLSVFGVADRGRALLFGLLSRFLPSIASQLIAVTFDEIVRSGGPLKMSFGVIFSLWSASMGMNAVIDTLNAAYDVRENRSLIKQYAVAIGLTLSTAILLIASVLVAVLGNHAVAAVAYGSPVAVAWRIAKWPLGFTLSLLLFGIIYYFAPAVTNRRWHWITPGAIGGLSLLMLISIGLRVYLHYTGTSAATYGSLGAVIVLLLTLYLCGIAVLFGGILNGVLERCAQG